MRKRNATFLDQKADIEEILDRLAEAARVESERKEGHPFIVRNVVLPKKLLLQFFIILVLRLPRTFNASDRGFTVLTQLPVHFLADCFQVRGLGLHYVLSLKLFRPDCISRISPLEPLPPLRRSSDTSLDAKWPEEKARGRRAEVVRHAGVSAEILPVEGVSFVKILRHFVVTVVTDPSSGPLCLCLRCGVTFRWPSAHEYNAFANKIIDIDAGGVFAQVQLSGSFRGEVCSRDQEARVKSCV